MAIGLIIIGDEIMSGKHTDKHFPRVIEMLKLRGLHLDWAEFIGDEPERIIATLRRTLASGDIVFSCGGIGATPDDHTRQCAAAALGVPLEMHPDAKTKIQQRIAFTAEKAGVAVDPDAPDYLQRLKMGEFPRGAQIIPNPVNQIPGFSVGTHYFVPGFPEMAAPMIEWALDSRHSNLFHRERHDEKSVLVFGAMEATLTPLMESIEADYPLVKVFSLPHMGDAASRGYIELGVKGDPVQVGEAFNRLVVALNAKNVEYRRI